MIAFLMGPTEWIIVLVVALLLFGRRLPEVMRNLGKGIVEFKRGVRGIEDEVNTAVSQPPQPSQVSESSNDKADTPKTSENE